MRKPRKFSGDTARLPPPYLRPRVGRVLVPAQCWTPPGFGWGCVRAARGTEAWVLSHNPSLFCPLLGPHLPRGAPGSVRPSPRSSFPGSGRVPVAALQEPVPAPASGPTNSAVPVTVAPNPRGRRRPSPAGPAPGAAASFRPRSRPGWGRRASLRVPQRDDPPPRSVSSSGGLGSRGRLGRRET